MSSRMPPTAPPVARWARIAFAVLAVALVLRTGVRDRGVITDHIEFGRRLLLGLDLYAPYLDPGPLHPPYPPSFGLLGAPFSLVPERAARFAWGGLQMGMLLVVLCWLRHAVVRFAPAVRRPDLVLLGALLLASRYVLRDTHGGGGNLINLGLVLGALLAADRGRTAAAAAMLGLSLATKPNLALLLPVLWLLGRRRLVLAGIGAAALLALASLALLRFDPSCWLRWLEGSFAYATRADVFAEPALGFPPFTWMNQGLGCALARWLGEVPAAHAAEVPHFVPGLGLAPGTVAALRGGMGVLLLAAVCAAAWRRRGAEPAVLAAALALALLLSPISWKAHHVALLPAFGLLFARVAEGRSRLWWAVAAYAVACVAGEEIVGKELKNLQQRLYLVTAGTVALLVASLRWAGRRDGVSAPG